MISQTKLKERARRKTNPNLAETIEEARKNASWKILAKLLTSSTRNFTSINLSAIDSQTSAGDTIVVPGKVLSGGELTKKIRICALSISERAAEKLKNSKSEFVTILEEIGKNKKAAGVKILR